MPSREVQKRFSVLVLPEHAPTTALIEEATPHFLKFFMFDERVGIPPELKEVDPEEHIPAARAADIFPRFHPHDTARVS